MKTILIAAVSLLAMVGGLSIVLYAVNHNVSVRVKQTSLLPSESIKVEGVAAFTPLTMGESDSLAMLEDKSLLNMTAGAFNPQFDPLSSSEQKTLKASEEQNPELQNMTAGESTRSSNTKRGLGAALFILLFYFLVIPF